MNKFDGTVQSIPTDVTIDVAQPYDLVSTVKCIDIKDPGYCLKMPIAFQSKNYVQVGEGELTTWINVTWKETYGSSSFSLPAGKTYLLGDVRVHGYNYIWHLEKLKKSSLFQADLRSLKEQGIRVPSDTFFAFILSHKVDRHHAVDWAVILPENDKLKGMTKEQIELVAERTLMSIVNVQFHQ
ncbi:MAG: hypothetical protein OCC46_15430 [Pseudodesulfovibrio sp.]